MCNLLGRGEVFRHILPVDDFPNRLHVVRAQIFVLQVVRVLPDVDPQKRRQADSCTWVLVRGGCNLERTRSLIIPKPAPARALHGDGLRGKLFLKLGERAKVTLDELKELSVRRRTILRRGKVLPENGVVDVPSAVELDRSLKGDHRGVVALHLCFRVLLHRNVKVGDVRVVVLGVVQLHDLAADDGLERSVVVIEIGQLCRDEGADLGGVAERSDRPGETTSSSEHGENPAAVHCALWFLPACYFFISSLLDLVSLRSTERV